MNKNKKKKKRKKNKKNFIIMTSEVYNAVLLPPRSHKFCYSLF